MHSSSMGGGLGSDLDSTWVNIDGRSVALVRKLTETTGARIVQEFGAGQVIVEVAPELGIGQAGFSRQDDTGSVHWGASRIVSADGSYWCSSAFMGDSGRPDGVITAGHCAPNGEGLKWPNGDAIQVYATSRENYNPGVGPSAGTPPGSWLATSRGGIIGQRISVALTYIQAG